jgi:hypothetical protein
MERLTYKFPSLTLANFAVNAIRKDKVGEVTNSQNGYITVETANTPAVKQIVEGVRGSEIFRESVEEAYKSSSVPAGASQEVHDKARRENPYKVRLKKGVPAGAGAKKEETEIEEKTKLTPDQLKKMNQGLKGKILDKKDAKKEDMEESASKAALEDFMYALPKAAIEELRPVMKMKQGVGRMAKITAVLKKHGITQKFMGAFPTSVVNDYFDTFHGESVEENEEKIDEQSVARRLGQTIGALRHGKPTPKDRLDDLTVERKRRDYQKKLKNDPVFQAQNAAAKKEEQDEIKRQIAYLKTFLTKEEVESVEEAKPMVGGQKKLDANKNGKLDAHDFKLLRAKKEEVEVNEAMNNYLAFYNGKKMTIQAETSYKAQLKAIEMFKAPASKKHMVTVKLADNKAALANNEETEVNEAAPTIKAGMKLRAKENKSVSNGSVVKGEQYKVADAGKNKFDLIHLSIGFRKAIRNVDASVIQALIQNKVLG